jgi:hypothetical protein
MTLAEKVGQPNQYSRSSTRRPDAFLPVRCLVQGTPLANAMIFADGRSVNGTGRFATERLTTDGQGLARIRLSAAWSWYVTFAHMHAVDAPEAPDANYEAWRATLAFGVRAGRR